VITVWKFKIPIEAMFTLEMPKEAEILHAEAFSDRDIFMWARVDDEAPLEHRSFSLIGTGKPVPTGPHIASFSLHAGDIILHLFERTTKRSLEERLVRLERQVSALLSVADV